MFSAIGSVLGNIFGTPKAIDNLIDKDKGLLAQAGGWVGNMSYTDQEKAEGDKATKEWGLRALDALAPFKVVQRILAFAAAGLWIFIGINVVVCIYIDAITTTKSVADGETVISAGTNLTEPMFALATSQYVFWPVCVVFALYFAGGVLPRKGGS